MAKRRRRVRGTGRVLKAGRTWGIRYTELGERKYSGGYENQDQAQHALDVIVAQIKAHLPGIPQEPATATVRRFDELVDEWMDYRVQHDDLRSVPDDRVRWRKHLEPLLATRDITSITSDLMSKLVVGLRAKKLSPATIERVIHLLSAFFKWAGMKGYTTSNPVKKYLSEMAPKQRAKLRSQHQPDDTLFLHSTEDVARVYQALPEPVNVAYALSALAGLRPGEVLALRWADVDLPAGKLSVARQVRHGKVSVPKSGKPRVVDMVPSLVEVLRAHQERNPGAELVVPPTLQLKKDGSLVPRRNRHGSAKFLNLRTVYAALEKALAACKLPQMSFYSAGRHSFASLWVLRGLDIYKLSKILGHSSVVVTSRYAHLTQKTPESVLQAADIKLAS